MIEELLTRPYWVIDFLRNGDQTNYEIFLHGGEIVHIRLNPGMCVKVR